MADAEARFAINLDTSQAQGAATALGSRIEQLKAQITQGAKALQEMQAAAQRLRQHGDVVAFEKAGEGLRRAQAEAAKFENKIAALQEKLSKTTNIEQARGIQRQIAEAQRGLEAAQGRVGALTAKREQLGQSEAVKAYKDVTAAIHEKKGALAEAQVELSRLGGSMTDTADSATAAAEGTGLFSSALTKMSGLGAATVVIALAAAFTLVTVAVARATYAVIAFATEIGDAARTWRIFADATARSEAGGEALAATVQRVHQRVGGARAEIQQLSLDLRRLGVEGQALENSVEAVSAATRVFGQSSGAAIKGLIDKAQLVRRGVLSPLELRGTGIEFRDVAAQVARHFRISMAAASAALANGQLKVEDFTRALRDATRARTGDALQKLALSLPEQFARARDNIEQIFKVDPTKILSGLNSILILLDESTETGKRLRSLMKTVFQPVIDFVGSQIFPILRGMVLGVIAVLIELAIVAIDVAIAFKRILPADFAAKWDLVEIGFWLGVAVAGALAAALIGLAAAFAALLTIVVAVTVAFLLPLIGIGLLIYGVKRLISTLTGGSEGESAGASLVDGIIEGVKSRAGYLFKELALLATGGLMSFNEAAQIKSPSRLFARSGEEIAAGVAVGVEEGAPMVSAAVTRLADPTAIDDAAGAVAGARAGTSSVNLTAKIDARGSSQAEGQRHVSFLAQLINVLDDAVQQAGGPAIRLANAEVTT